MKKHSTLIYFVNNYQSKGSIISDDDLIIEDSLTAMDFEPSQGSIESILNFARSYEVLESKNTGHIEMNLN